ncbi:MAG: DUF2059 domain-containing protein [Ignavibacteria bacterium]|nr:DUF2059 domain-containing protein [Ignavibacteria bacterium]
MKKSFAITALMLILVTNCFAQSESHRKAAEKYLSISKFEKVYQAIADNIDSTLASQFENLDFTAEQDSISKEYRKKTYDIVVKTLQAPELLKSMVDLYVQMYSEKEINDLIIFYNTKTGKRIIDSQEELSKKSVEILVKHLETAKPELDKIEQAYADKLKTTSSEDVPAAESGSDSK